MVLRGRLVRAVKFLSKLQKLKERGMANRTCNLAVVVFRNVFKSAKVDGFVKTLPVEGIDWLRSKKKARRLFTREDIGLFCRAALTASRNGTAFAAESAPMQFRSISGSATPGVPVVG